MKILAIICNIILFGFICLVLVTDGLSGDIIYIVLNLWWMLTLIFNIVVLFRSGANDGWLNLQIKRKSMEGQKKNGELSLTSSVLRIVAIICNIIFIGFACWAFIDQYPHPKEYGLIAFAVLMILTPILSLVAFSLTGSRRWSARS
jgi:hypothetical protein